ncbi:MAG TPA: metal ABC transporter ATP-binding protein [Thermoleophilaceae bacterium]|nr:metal ABC transporter ATP-binding protein [Thermoleophilaceae bacterium]
MSGPAAGGATGGERGANGTAVRVHDLSLAYGGGPVLEGVDFSLAAGESLCVLGPNGGGKTTLLRALTGELAALRGSADVAGRPAYLAQTERTRLDFPVSALDVALMGSLANGRWWLPARRSDRAAARAALARVGLEDRAGVRFGELSGGQRQRVLLARALVQDAAVLLLDEPLAGVDPASAERIATLFAELRDEGRTLLVSTHDVDSARDFDRVLCLNRRQVAFGEPASVLTRTALEQTYGSEIVVLEDEGGAGPVRAIAVQHHAH